MVKVTLTPDSGFARELIDAGGDSLKKCYQCATCSVACPMAPANNPYPRKEMVWASWGQKDKLMADPDIWLCHNCGNCAELCPRGAKPADVMAACRNVVYKNLVQPSKVGEWMSSPKGLPMLFLIPAILWLVIWAIRAAIVGAWFPRTEDGLPALQGVQQALELIQERRRQAGSRRPHQALVLPSGHAPLGRSRQSQEV